MDTKINEKTINTGLIAGAAWAVVATLAGMVNQTQLYLHLPGADSFLGYGKLRPIYTTALIYGSALSFFFAAAYYIVKKIESVEPKGVLASNIAYAGVIVHQVAIAIAVLTLLSGINKGREYGELPWISDFLVAVSLIIFLYTLSGTLRGKETLYVPTRYAIISGAGILAVHIFGNLSLPYGILSSALYFNGMQDAAVQEFFRMGVLGFFILMPAFMILYYFVPTYYRVPLYSEKTADFQAVTTLAMTALAGGVGLVFSTADSLMQTVGIIANAALTVSIIAGVVNINLTITKADISLRSDSTSNLFRIGTLFILILSLFRAFGGLRIFQERFSYTWWNFLDLSLDANTYVLIISFAGAYLILQNLRGQAISAGGINLHLMLALVGTALILASDLIQGTLSYYNLKALAEDGTFQYGWSRAVGLSDADGNPALFGLRAVAFLGYASLAVSVLIAFMNSISPMRSTDRPYTEPSLRA